MDGPTNTTNSNDWRNVDANRLISLLRERISDLEYQLAIMQLQVENLTGANGKSEKPVK